MSTKGLTLRKQSGFVLPLTLAGLVLLILIASYVGSISQTAVTKVIATRDQVESAYLLESAKARIIQILALTPRTVFGLGAPEAKVIVPDGRTYAIGTHLRVQFQDLRGLLPINASLESPAPTQRLSNLLSSYGLPADQVAGLIDKLYDYRDSDDLVRINGAEKPEYLAQGKPEPRNWNLQDVSEIYRVAGWLDARKKWQDDDIMQYLSIDNSVAFNPNVAPARVITAVTGLPLDDAKKLVVQKRQSPDGNIAALLFPNLGDPFSGSGFVLRNMGPAVRVTLWDMRYSWASQFEMKITPDQPIRPWLISNARQVLAPLLGVDEMAPEMLPTLEQLLFVTKIDINSSSLNQPSSTVSR
jgi:hypothetical protein